MTRQIRCLLCLSPTTASRRSQRYCSKRCAGRDTRGAALRKSGQASQDWAAGHQPLHRRACMACGLEMLTRSHRPLCDPCRAQRRRDHYAHKNFARRGAAIGRRYSIAEIGDREDWRCHLCGEAVDRKLSGTDALGPTRDHVIPISEGGLDTIENVRLAHRRCNMARGAQRVAA